MFVITQKKISRKWKIVTLIIIMGTILVRGQSMTDKELKKFSKELNKEFVLFQDEISGISGRNVTSIGRKLIFQYNVPSEWTPNWNLKDELIKSLYNVESHSMYVEEQIDLGFIYFNDNKLVKSIDVNWEELEFRLGDYLDLSTHPKSNGLELKVKVPLGWEIKEGTGNHIVKTLNGRDILYLIFISETGKFLPSQEVEESFSKESFRDNFITEFFDKKDFVLEKQKLVTIEHHPFIQVTGIQKGERMGIEMEHQVYYWVTLIEDQLLYVGGMGFERSKNYYEKLYRITNSLKLPIQ